MGQQQALLKQRDKFWHGMFLNYVKTVGDLKIFFDIQGRTNARFGSECPYGSGSSRINSQQEWVYEVGTRYGKNAGHCSYGYMAAMVL